MQSCKRDTGFQYSLRPKSVLGEGGSCSGAAAAAAAAASNIKMFNSIGAFQEDCFCEIALVYALPWMLHPSFLRSRWESSTTCSLCALAEPART
jgi:hypothetical protein